MPFIKLTVGQGSATLARVTMTSIYLERRELSHHRQRFYAITVPRTLFDGWAARRVAAAYLVKPCRGTALLEAIAAAITSARP